jgi:hypothetical protein
MDWSAIAKQAQEAFRQGVNDWIGAAQIRGGQVRGTGASLTPGSLVSSVNIETVMQQKMLSSQIPADIARALASALAGAWNDWASRFQMEVPNAYPTFAAFPGPNAPPTPTATGPIPLSRGFSAGEASLKAAVLGPKLTSALRAHAGKMSGPPDQVLKNLAQWVESSFTEWKAMATLVGVMGKGPVPTFAPPYVPVGPVIMGDNLSAGPVFAGPRFGKVSI